MLRFLLSALLSISAATAIAAPAKASKARPVTRATCPQSVPFALPDERLTADWGDLEWELYSVNAWSVFCQGREGSFECRCAEAFGGGPY